MNETSNYNKKMHDQKEIELRQKLAIIGYSDEWIDKYIGGIE